MAASRSTSPALALARASSVPPKGASGIPPALPTLVSSITSAVDRAEGMRAQRAEALQRELIRATRDNGLATQRMAAALEQIGSTLAELKNILAT